MTILGAQSLTKRYGETVVLDKLDLEVRAGERLALLGHNGAGKTTFIKLAAGLTRPSAGGVQVLGGDPTDVAVRRRIGFLPEDIALSATMTGRELLAFYARLKGCPKTAVADLLDEVGLSDAAAKRIKTYSKGMRQRLGLAQALLGEPQLLLLDEPTNGLDPDLRRHFYDLVRARATAGTAAIMSSHILTELEARTDRIVILRHGRLIAAGPLDDLRRAAGLPVRIRLAVRPDGGDRIVEQLGTADPTRINDHAVELSCAIDEKLALVRRIVSLGVDISDIDITPPGLDEIYHSLGNREAQS